jgi:phosphatidylglycerol:prolipoprotein diacylglycerol transferase
MHRILFKIGAVTVYSYGFMLALAFLVGGYIARNRARKEKIHPDIIMDLIFYILISSLAGARALFVALNWDYYKAHLADIFKIWEGGLVFYGGLIFAFLAAAWFLRTRRLAFWKVVDILSPGLAIGIAIGRIGCFLNGCCYGELSRTFGVCYPAAENPPAYAQQLAQGLILPGAPYSLPVLPTQIFDSLAGLCIFLILAGVEKRKKFDGQVFLSFVFLYAIARFITEALRYYEPQYMLFNFLTISQLISVVISAIALVFLCKGLSSLKKGHPVN